MPKAKPDPKTDLDYNKVFQVYFERTNIECKERLMLILYTHFGNAYVETSYGTTMVCSYYHALSGKPETPEKPKINRSDRDFREIPNLEGFIKYESVSIPKD
ncbi:MAG: hypothetical protein ABH817_00710 [archaeon]